MTFATDIVRLPKNTEWSSLIAESLGVCVSIEASFIPPTFPMTCLHLVSSCSVLSQHFVERKKTATFVFSGLKWSQMWKGYGFIEALTH